MKNPRFIVLTGNEHDNENLPIRISVDHLMYYYEYKYTQNDDTKITCSAIVMAGRQWIYVKEKPEEIDALLEKAYENN